MKIPSINTIMTEPVRVEYAGTKTQAATQKNTDKTLDISQQIKPPITDDRKSVDETRKPDREEIVQELDKLNKELEFMNRSIRFSVDEDSNEIVVKVVDKVSGEVISQIPSDEIINLKKRLEEMTGLLVEKTV